MKQKVDHDLVLLFFQQGQSYTDIAKKVGISKQRVYQIVRKNSLGKKGREEKYETLGGVCASCGEEANLLHHIDGNFLNEDITNLIPLCRFCHGRVHSRKIKSKEEIEGKNLERTPTKNGVFRVSIYMPEDVHAVLKNSYKQRGYTTMNSFIVQSAIQNMNNNQHKLAQSTNYVASSGGDFSLKEDNEKTTHDHS